MSNPNIHYYPTYQRPPKAAKSVVSKISRLFPLASCLDDALTEIIQEDKASASSDHEHEHEHEHEHDNDNGNEGDTCPSQRRGKNHITIVNDTFKEVILNKCGEFMSDAFETEGGGGQQKRKQSSSSYSSSTTHTPPAASKNERNVTVVDNNSEPPAGLLQGKLKYYNRFGTQWRIVVTDAEIRPRVNINYPKLKRTEITSLVEESRQRVEMELRHKRLRRSGHSHGHDDDRRNDGTCERLYQDGVIKLDGDLLLLAYDDK